MDIETKEDVPEGKDKESKEKEIEGEDATIVDVEEELIASLHEIKQLKKKKMMNQRRC